jgi:hypothetical protein
MTLSDVSISKFSILYSDTGQQPLLTVNGVLFLQMELGQVTPQSGQSVKLFLQSSDLGLSHPSPAG